jgi:hypothetical protein
MTVLDSVFGELPVANRRAGIVVAALGVAVLYAGWYAGWYDRSDSQSEASAADTGGCKFVKIFATPGCRSTSVCYSHQYDSVTGTPARTTGPREIVHKYVSTGLLTIGVWLLLGQTRAEPVFGFGSEPVELPWGELPVLGGAFVVSAVLVFAFTHPRSPFFEAE